MNIPAFWLMPKAFLIVVVFVFYTTVVGANIVPVEVQHIYYAHPEEANSLNAEAGNSAVNVFTGEVFPYSTLVFNFFSNFESNQGIKEFFQDNLRVLKVTAQGDIPLHHLHEKMALVDRRFRINPPVEMPFVGPNASFYWTIRDGMPGGASQLRYSPFGLDGGSTYKLVLPEYFFSSVDGTGELHFSTAPFTGDDPRIYEVVIPDLSDWRTITIEGPAQSKAEVETYVFDRFSGGMMDNQTREEYYGTSIRVRGNTSLSQPQKRFNLEFDRGRQFIGFKDQDGFQGERRRMILQAGQSNFGVVDTLFRNKVGLHLMRELERKVFDGVALSPDSFFCHLVINGHYWGVYLAVEHISTGRGGLTSMAARKKAGFLEGSILHKVGDGGAASIGHGFPPFEPRTRFEVLARNSRGEVILGNGVQRSFFFDAPFSIWGTATPFEEMRTPELKIEIEADFDPGAGHDIRMRLIPDLDDFQTVNWGIHGDVPHFTRVNLFEEGGDSATRRGSLQNLHTRTPRVMVDFPDPVESGKSIEFEFRSGHDALLLKDALGSNRNNTSFITSWIAEESVFRHIFFVKWASALDHLGHNFFYLMNTDNLDEVLVPGSNPAIPWEPYRFILWDCDFCMLPGAIDHGRMNLNTAFWRDTVNAPGSESRYVEQIISEVNNGGVCTLEFYEDLISSGLEHLGDDFDFHTSRWGAPGPDSDFLDNYIQEIIVPKLTSRDFLRDFVMSLHKGQAVEPNFVRGDADLDGDVDFDDVRHIFTSLFANRKGLVNYCFLENSCDVDDDGVVEFEDAARLIGFLNGNRNHQPASPFPNPGQDNTVSGLDW